MALFRHGRCQERVRHFGASAYGAAAVAQNSGGPRVLSLQNEWQKVGKFSNFWFWNNRFYEIS